MKKVSVVALLVIALLLLAGTANALRCGNLFIEKGVTRIHVPAECGEPIAKEDLGFYLQPATRLFPNIADCG